MSNRVYIFDTTLRDGEQSPGCSMTVPEKLKMAAHLADLGVDVMEAGFPIASQGDFDAVDAVSRQFPWIQVAALARSNKMDVERAAESLKHAKRPRIHTFIATSEIHLKFKLKKSQEQVLEDAVNAVRLARQYCDDVEFSAEDATRTDLDYLERVSKAVVEAGARTEELHPLERLTQALARGVDAIHRTEEHVAEERSAPNAHRREGARPGHELTYRLFSAPRAAVLG